MLHYQSPGSTGIIVLSINEAPRLNALKSSADSQGGGGERTRNTVQNCLEANLQTTEDRWEGENEREIEMATIQDPSSL